MSALRPTTKHEQHRVFKLARPGTGTQARQFALAHGLEALLCKLPAFNKQWQTLKSNFALDNRACNIAIGWHAPYTPMQSLKEHSYSNPCKTETETEAEKEAEKEAKNETKIETRIEATMIELADLLGRSAYELLALSLLCWLLSHAVRFYALKANVVDVPGERSSHSQVTPRGGGLAIVITAIIAAVIQWQSAPTAESTQPWLLAIYLPAGILGLISFIDDHKPLSRRLRIMVHLFCAGLLLYLLPSTVYLPIGDYSLDISAWWLLPISLIAIGWLINLYNFMDGIDGIAASEGISMLFGLSFIIYLQNGQLDGQLLALSAILIGFLCINWAPAKLFMGDIGSCFLGLALFACACYCSAQYQINLWASRFYLQPLLLTPAGH